MLLAIVTLHIDPPHSLPKARQAAVLQALREQYNPRSYVHNIETAHLFLHLRLGALLGVYADSLAPCPEQSQPVPPRGPGAPGPGRGGKGRGMGKAKGPKLKRDYVLGMCVSVLGVLGLFMQASPSPAPQHPELMAAFVKGGAAQALLGIVAGCPANSPALNASLLSLHQIAVFEPLFANLIIGKTLDGLLTLTSSMARQSSVGVTLDLFTQLLWALATDTKVKLPLALGALCVCMPDCTPAAHVQSASLVHKMLLSHYDFFDSALTLRTPSKTPTNAGASSRAQLSMSMPDTARLGDKGLQENQANPELISDNAGPDGFLSLGKWNKLCHAGDESGGVMTVLSGLMPLLAGMDPQVQYSTSETLFLLYCREPSFRSPILLPLLDLLESLTTRDTTHLYSKARQAPGREMVKRKMSLINLVPLGSQLFTSALAGMMSFQAEAEMYGAGHGEPTLPTLAKLSATLPRYHTGVDRQNEDLKISQDSDKDDPSGDSDAADSDADSATSSSAGLDHPATLPPINNVADQSKSGPKPLRVTLPVTSEALYGAARLLITLATAFPEFPVYQHLASTFVIRDPAEAALHALCDPALSRSVRDVLIRLIVTIANCFDKCHASVTGVLGGALLQALIEAQRNLSKSLVQQVVDAAVQHYAAPSSTRAAPSSSEPMEMPAPVHHDEASSPGTETDSSPRQASNTCIPEESLIPYE
eukprot:gene6486-1155_t